MATELEQKPVAASAKHETYVERELAKARGRIRVLDAGGFFLVFLVATLGYGFLLILLDRALELSTAVRLATFVCYLGVGGYFLFRSALCLVRRVNPYYAARQLEQTLPEAKNSIINWLDLRGEKLPPAIRNSLGLRAAKDLKHADPEQAINSRLPLLLGAVVMGLLLGLLVLFVMDNQRFGDLLGRVFAPFREIKLSTRTTITLLEPSEGNVAVPLNRPIQFRAEIANAPAITRDDAPRLLYRYNDSESYDPKVSLPLALDRNGYWTATILPDQVQGGFSYKITAGDAETDEYHVTVQDPSRVTRYEVSYRYRPYLRLPDQSTLFPNPDAPNPYVVGARGTEVTLVAHTNRKLEKGHLEFDMDGVRQERPGELVAGDARALRFKFVLEKSGAFRVRFRAEDADENSNPSFYKMDVFTDDAPRVELTKPAKDVELPANGTLSLEGFATDDFGLTNMTLRFKVLGQTRDLEHKPYRPGISFRFADGTYPKKLDYKDFLALDQLKTAGGAAFPLAKGMVLEYWLEATDNSDYPHPKGNVTKSKPFKVTILAPQAKEKSDDDRKQAEQARQDHNANQNQQLAKEQREKQSGGNNPENKLQNQQDQLQNDAKDLQKALKKEEDRVKQAGAGKGADPKPGESKRPPEEPKDTQNPKDPKNQKDKGPGAVKNEKPADPEQAGQPKDEGPDTKTKKAEAKKGNEKEPKQNDQKKSQGKGGSGESGAGVKGDEGKKRADPSQAAGAKGPPQGNPSSAKDQGKGDKQQEAAKGKSDGPGGMMGEARAAEKKDAGDSQPGAQAKNEGGPADQKPPQRAEAKPGPNGPKDQAAKATEAPKAGPKDSKPGECRGDGPQGAQAAQEQKPGQANGAPRGNPEADAPKSLVKKSDDAKQPPGAGTKGAGGSKNPEGTAKEMDQKQVESAEARGQGKPPETDNAREAAERKLKRLEEALKKLQGMSPEEREKLIKDAKKLDDLEKLAQLAEEAKSDDQANRNEAAKKLEKMVEEFADDPRLRELAKQLEEEARNDARAKGAGGDPKQNPDGQPKEEDKTGQVTAEAKADAVDPKNKAERGKGKGEDGKPNPQYVPEAKDNGDRAGDFGPGGKGIPFEERPFDPNEEFRRYGGNLNLEQLKKKIKDNPDFLGPEWSTERWEQFLKDIEAYNRDLAKVRSQPSSEKGPRTTAPGQGSQVPGSAEVIRGNNNSGGATVNRPDVPPQYLELYRYFSRPGTAPPKK